MNEAEEKAYALGSRAALRHVLAFTLSQLGNEGFTAERLALERAEAVSMLRQVCEEHGDNDWPDNLHLADVIEKHLWRHLGGDSGEDSRYD